jgi:hypothetical protein
MTTSPLFGFRPGEVAQFHYGWGGPRQALRVLGPGSRPTSIAVDDLDYPFRWPENTDVDAWNLMHDTPVFHAWIALWEGDLSEDRRSRSKQIRDKHLAALRLATEALIAANPQLLIVRDCPEGGQRHSWAVCHRAWLIEAEAGTPARIEEVIRTITDPEILDHIRGSSAREAELSERNAPWLDDEDRVILRRIASWHG